MQMMVPLIRYSGTVLIRTHVFDAKQGVWNPDPLLKGTVLGFLVGDDPNVELTSGVVVNLRDSLEDCLRPQMISRTVKGVSSEAFYIMATDRINLFDYLLSGDRVDGGLVQRQMWQAVASLRTPQYHWAGLMRHTVGCPALPGEFWVCPSDARSLVLAARRLYPETLPVDLVELCDKVRDPQSGDWTGDVGAAQKLNARLDGVHLFGNRYPNVTSTSCSRVVLRVVKGFSKAIGVNLGWFVHQFQGDADGDLAMVLAPPMGGSWSKGPGLSFKEENLTPVRNSPLGVGGKSLGFFDLAAPRDSNLKSFQGQLVRGQYVGQLTRANWILCSLAVQQAEVLGLSPIDAYRQALDLGAPMTEGVMDARKDSAGADTITQVADALLGVISGKVAIGHVLHLVGLHMMRDEAHPEDVNHFSVEQLGFLSKLLKSTLPEGQTDGKVKIDKLVGSDPAIDSAFVRRAHPEKVFEAGVGTADRLLQALYVSPKMGGL